MAGAPAAFPVETAWSTILAARDRASLEWRARLGRLVAAYWRPVFWHLQRRWKLPPEVAADLAREFLLKVFQGDALDRATPDRGRFRTFLKTQLRDFVVDDLRRRMSTKGGGEVADAALDPGEAEPWCHDLDAEEAFDRDWAACLIQDSIRDLESSLAAEGKEIVYRAFGNCVLSSPPKSYRECADLLGIKESDVRNHVYAARSGLREIVRGRVRESLERQQDLEEEFAYLMELFDR